MKTPIAHYNSCIGCPKCSNNGFSKPSILWLDFLSKLYNMLLQQLNIDQMDIVKKIILYMNFMVITGMVIRRNLILMTLMRLQKKLSKTYTMKL
jgi:hypothetical protein